MTLPADDATEPPDLRTAEEKYLDARLAVAAERWKDARFVRGMAARKLADYMVREQVSDEETASQLEQYRLAIDDEKVAYDRYVARDNRWFRN